MDCRKYLKNIKKNTVDLILIDPPYNELPATWDNFKDWDNIGLEFDRVLKNNGYLYIFGKQPMMSDIYAILKEKFDFRFELIWNKNKGFWSSNFTPMRSHELIWSFKKKGARVSDLYFNLDAVKTPGKPYIRKNKVVSTVRNSWKPNHTIYKDGNRFPLSVINEKPVIRKKLNHHRLKHPTEKPVSLLEWIIKSSSRKNDIILDCFMGSGSTAVAAKKNNRKFLGCEMNKDFVKLSNIRLSEID